MYTDFWISQMKADSNIHHLRDQRNLSNPRFRHQRNPSNLRFRHLRDQRNPSNLRFRHQRELEMPIYYDGQEIGTRRVDFLVEGKEHVRTADVR